MRLFALLLLVCLMLPTISRAESIAFGECLGRLQQLARERQLPEWIVEDVVGKLEYQSRVIELDRKQPEFIQTFEQYYRNRVTASRVERGRELYAKHQNLLLKLTQQYGVPGHYLIAFWGMETNFGSYLGKMPTLDSLATLACDERRGDFFATELITALTLLERDKLSTAQMRGSWAGAMGHVQFMPSTYHRFAVDGNADGRVDLWGSSEDALTSAANYLSQLGWQTGERWGRQVLLPQGFDYRQTGMGNPQPLSYWRELGVLRADRRELPDLPLETAILAPMGHLGPAFVLYRNFSVIMRWNRSHAYALSIGLLADSIAGAPGLPATVFHPVPTLNRQLIEQLQAALNAKGFSTGEPDGIIGPATRSALRQFQASIGLTADGFPDFKTLTALELGGADG